MEFGNLAACCGKAVLADALFQMLGVAKKVSTRQKLNARSQPALLTLVRSKLYCRPKGERSDNK